VLQLDPAFTVSGYIARGGQLNAKQAIEGFRKAGLPEWDALIAFSITRLAKFYVSYWPVADIPCHDCNLSFQGGSRRAVLGRACLQMTQADISTPFELY